MTLDEAHKWLVQNARKVPWFCIEWYGGKPSYWTSYVWFGPAGEKHPHIEGTFLECVVWLQKQATKAADRLSTAPGGSKSRVREKCKAKVGTGGS